MAKSEVMVIRLGEHNNKILMNFSLLPSTPVIMVKKQRWDMRKRCISLPLTYTDIFCSRTWQPGCTRKKSLFWLNTIIPFAQSASSNHNTSSIKLNFLKMKTIKYNHFKWIKFTIYWDNNTELHKVTLAIIFWQP